MEVRWAGEDDDELYTKEGRKPLGWKVVGGNQSHGIRIANRDEIIARNPNHWNKMIELSTGHGFLNWCFFVDKYYKPALVIYAFKDIKSNSHGWGMFDDIDDLALFLVNWKMKCEPEIEKRLFDWR